MGRAIFTRLASRVAGARYQADVGMPVAGVPKTAFA
jgi:hypothetical protein